MTKFHMRHESEERKTSLTAHDRMQIRQAIIEEVENRPPTIGLIGVSGGGKSSTINTMFKTKLPTSDTIACTQEFSFHQCPLVFKDGEAKDYSVILQVADAPGLGEDIARDPLYLEMYQEYLKKCDVILWVLAARNRAVAIDQMYLENLKEFHDKMIFGINQVDLVEPLNWKTINSPSAEQKRNIEEILHDRYEKIVNILGHPIKIVPYSANKPYNMMELFNTIIHACPTSRSWMFSNLKGISYIDEIPLDVRDEVLKHLDTKPYFNGNSKKKAVSNFWPRGRN